MSKLLKKSRVSQHFYCHCRIGKHGRMNQKKFMMVFCYAWEKISVLILRQLHLQSNTRGSVS